MSKSSFRDFDDSDGESIFDEDLAAFEYFEKRRHVGRHGDDNDGRAAPRREHKSQRRNSDASAHRS